MKTTYKNQYEIIPELIKAKSFEVEFVKQNNEVRVMECVFESLRYINQGIMTVLDTAKNAYRSINFDKITKIIIGNAVFELQQKRLTYIGNRKIKQLALLENHLNVDIAKFNDWNYQDIKELCDELIYVSDSDLNAIRALLENNCNIDFYTIKSVLDGKLEFFENITLSEVAEHELFTINIPIPDTIDTSYIDYKFQIEDLEPYYAETSYGVIQYEFI